MKELHSLQSDVAVEDRGLFRGKRGNSLQELKQKKRSLGGEKPKQREVKRDGEGRRVVLCFQKFLVERFYGDPATSTSDRQPAVFGSRVFVLLSGYYMWYLFL